VADGRKWLAQARAETPAEPDATSRATLARLGAIEEQAVAGRAWARSEVEYVRVAFADWACLSEEHHQRFHTTLPPVP
jgi:hypothetical protein